MPSAIDEMARKRVGIQLFHAAFLNVNIGGPSVMFTLCSRLFTVIMLSELISLSIFPYILSCYLNI